MEGIEGFSCLSKYDLGIFQLICESLVFGLIYLQCQGLQRFQWEAPHIKPYDKAGNLE